LHLFLTYCIEQLKQFALNKHNFHFITGLKPRCSALTYIWEYFQFHVTWVVNIQPSQDQIYFNPIHKKNKLRDLSPQVNYVDWATAALSTKFVPTFADKGSHVVSMTDPCGRVLRFLDRLWYYINITIKILDIIHEIQSPKHRVMSRIVIVILIYNYYCNYRINNNSFIHLFSTSNLPVTTDYAMLWWQGTHLTFIRYDLLQKFVKCKLNSTHAVPYWLGASADTILATLDVAVSRIYYYYKYI
jgi:hypothetical protein